MKSGIEKLTSSWNFPMQILSEIDAVKSIYIILYTLSSLSGKSRHIYACMYVSSCVFSSECFCCFGDTYVNSISFAAAVTVLVPIRIVYVFVNMQ